VKDLGTKEPAGDALLHNRRRQTRKTRLHSQDARLRAPSKEATRSRSRKTLQRYVCYESSGLNSFGDGPLCEQSCVP